MELEQHRIVHESILKGKDLVIQKLRLQLAVRDKLIQRQQNVLTEHGLDGKVTPPPPPSSLMISTLSFILPSRSYLRPLVYLPPPIYVHNPLTHISPLTTLSML